MKPKALQGIRILDLTRIYAGPYCSMLFADLGAEVIKIEPPEGEIIRDNPPLIEEGQGGPNERSRSGYFLTLNRNKYGITLNLKHPKAVSIFKELVKIGDVVLENYAPGVMKRLGIDYPVLQKINPRLVMASISGFGQWGPYSERIAFDVHSQAMSGLMSITGHPGNPPHAGGDIPGRRERRHACCFCHHGCSVATRKDRRRPVHRRIHAGSHGLDPGRGDRALDNRPRALDPPRFAQPP